MTNLFLNGDTFLVTCFFLALLLPFLSFTFSLLTSERYSWLAGLNAPLLMLVSTLCSIVVLTASWDEPPQILAIHWFTIGALPISANLSLSNTSMLMLCIVSGISFLVHLYSAGYMVRDRNIKKYFAMLGFFTFSMQGIVVSDSLLLLFVFWELVGFSSYMLIGHWMHKPEAAKAAQKAFLFNRIGDAGFLVGLMIVWAHTGTFNVGEIVSLTPSTWQTAATLFIFCGVMGKSAQFPLFTWLPDAMEGPTPVSALIHAATMVAAGVYLCVRLFHLFTPTSLTVVACIGMITALIGSLSALFQFDIKRVLAYSTISQLGLMMMAVGLGVVNAALLHLFTHAFFKACLFLSAGSVIHALHQSQFRASEHFDSQDIRNMGGLRKKLPVTFFAFLLGAASLAGIPFFSGFLSKEAMLSAAWMNNSLLSWLFLSSMIGVSFITVLYTFRLTWLVFMGEERKASFLPVKEVPVIMRLPAVILGSLSLWFVVSWNPFDAVGWLLPQDFYTPLPWLTVFSVVWIVLALVIAYFVFRKAQFYDKLIFRHSFFVDRFYERIVGPAVQFVSAKAEALDLQVIDKFIHAGAYAHVTAAHLTGWFDKTIVDGLVNACATISRMIGSFTRSFQGGKIQLYIFWSVFALIIFIIWTSK